MTLKLNIDNINLNLIEMQSVTSKWFECAVKLERTDENGEQKKITETYVVEALSFTEAEQNIIKELASYTSGELEIKKIAPMSISEIFFSNKDSDDQWYKCKLAFITIDEKSDKEKRSSVSYLVQAASLETALSYIVEEMRGTMIDYLASNISETKILDVIRN